MQNQDGEYDIEGHKGDIEKLRIEVKKRDGIINSSRRILRPRENE